MQKRRGEQSQLKSHIWHQTADAFPDMCLCVAASLKMQQQSRLSVGQAAAPWLHSCPALQPPTVRESHCWPACQLSLRRCLLQAQKLVALAAKVEVDHRLAALQRRFDGLQTQHAESEKAVLLAQVCPRDRQRSAALR